MKTIELEELHERTSTFRATFQEELTIDELYKHLKQCHSLLADSVRKGSMPPFDISYQQRLWTIRDEIIKLGNDIAQKIGRMQ